MPLFQLLSAGANYAAASASDDELPGLVIGNKTAIRLMSGYIKCTAGAAAVLPCWAGSILSTANKDGILACTPLGANSSTMATVSSRADAPASVAGIIDKAQAPSSVLASFCLARRDGLYANPEQAGGGVACTPAGAQPFRCPGGFELSGEGQGCLPSTGG